MALHCGDFLGWLLLCRLLGMKEPLGRGVFGCWKVCEWVKVKGSDAVCVPASCALSPEPACVQLHSTHRVGWGLCGTWAAGRRGIASSRVQSGAGFLPISFRREMMFEVVLPWAGWTASAMEGAGLGQSWREDILGRNLNLMRHHSGPPP